MIKAWMCFFAVVIMGVPCFSEPNDFRYESFPRSLEFTSDGDENGPDQHQKKISFSYTYPKGDEPCAVHFGNNYFFLLNPREKKDVFVHNWDEWFGDKRSFPVVVTYYGLSLGEHEYTISDRVELNIAKDYLDSSSMVHLATSGGNTFYQNRASWAQRDPTIVLRLPSRSFRYNAQFDGQDR